MSLGVVEETTEYSKFKRLEHNRELDSGHVSRLESAIRENPRILRARPVLTNEDFEIIDGQHRFEACKRVGVAVPYIVMEGLRVDDAQAMNMHQKNWSLYDYAKSYASMGKSDYMYFLSAVERYRLPLGMTARILAGVSDGGTTQRKFKSGEFSIPNRDQAKETLDTIMAFGEIVPEHYRLRSFVRAFIAVSSVPGFSLDRFKSQMVKYAPSMLMHYERVADYVRAFEEIYNKNYGENNRLRMF